jgi:hypothetical protein
MIPVAINKGCLEYMVNLGMILDYTDDGFAYREDSGWVPVGDIVEFYLGMEDFYLEEWKEKASTARLSETDRRTRPS